ncbi:MAG TPA: N-acetylmuramoyl-L-alanine amidase [bacterium]|nr:N-acetylmuramoyl-L-alanine amidase [bacterium]
MTNKFHAIKALKFHRLFNFIVLLVVLTGGFYYLSIQQQEEMMELSARPDENQVAQVASVDEIKELATKGAEDPGGAEIPTLNKSVCLDPGHGGDDPGAMRGKIFERDINLIVAEKVRNLLESKGYTVFMTRTKNSQGLSKFDRYSFCNEKNTAILVAIHHNSYTSTKVNYTTALYYTEHDQLLAESIARSVSSSLKLENKGIAWFDNSVLSKSRMPAVFSEAFFLTNATELSRLSKKDYSRLEKEAEGVVNGIVNYFTDPTKFKPTFTSEELKIDRSDW